MEKPHKIMILLLLMLIFSIQTTGIDVKYKPKPKEIVKPVHISKVIKPKKIKYDAKTIYLAKLIQSEGLNQPLKAKIGIGNVILNRHKSYSHNLINVKRIVNARGQFDGTKHRLFRIKPSEECLIAASLAYKGINTIGKATHFCNRKECSPSWVHKFKFIKRIGDTSFYENSDWYKVH